jgi:hypothetical protein
MRWLRFTENLRSGHVSVQVKHRDTTLSFSLEHPVSSSKNENCTDSLYWLERKRPVRRMTPSQGWFEDCGEEGADEELFMRVGVGTGQAHSGFIQAW